MVGLVNRAESNQQLIPRNVLFGNPEIAGVSLSPDGQSVVYLAPFQGVLNLWVKDLHGEVVPRLLTKSSSCPQKVAFWSPDGRYLISTRDTQGDENTVLVRIDPKTGKSTDLTPESGVQARFVAGDREAPNEVVIGLNDRDARYHDLYVLNLESGERRLLYLSPDDGSQVSVEWMEGAWQPVLRFQPLADGGCAYELRLPGDKSWRTFLHISFEDTMCSMPTRFTRDGLWLFGILSTGDDHPRLVRWSRAQLNQCPNDCFPEVIHYSKSGLLDVVLLDPESNEPRLLREVDLRSRNVVLDPVLERDVRALENLSGHNEFKIVDSDLNSRFWLFVIGSDQQVDQYWLWDRELQKHRKLFSAQPRLDDFVLAPMESLNLQARDGLRLPVYLTRSLLEGSVPQPLVMLVHGGPHSRDFWGLNSMHQLLANRGYHAMSVNYRGSIGFGKAHLLAGEGEWYGRMQDDLVDAVNWAVDEEIADPDRLVIMGASYGGYAALSGITRDIDCFSAAVAAVAPSNLNTFLASIPPYWESIRTTFERMIGVGKVDLDEISPLNHVDRIKSPLLLVHGANDSRVNLQESEAIGAAMEARKLPIDFIVFPDEGHFFTNPLNKIAMIALVEAFLQQHIGGRAEPFGDALKQSSLEWRLRSLPTP